MWLQVALVLNNLPVRAGEGSRLGFDTWVCEILGGGHGKPLQCSCLRIHGKRSLAGYEVYRVRVGHD